MISRHMPLRVRSGARLLRIRLRAGDAQGLSTATCSTWGGAMPGVSVTITNVDTNVSATLTTNSTGYYQAPFCCPGTTV